MISRLLAATGLVVTVLAVLGALGVIEFRLYAGNDFATYCRKNP